VDYHFSADKKIAVLKDGSMIVFDGIEECRFFARDRPDDVLYLTSVRDLASNRA